MPEPGRTGRLERCAIAAMGRTVSAWLSSIDWRESAERPGHARRSAAGRPGNRRNPGAGAGAAGTRWRSPPPWSSGCALRLYDLALQDGELVAQREDLDVLVHVAGRQQSHEVEYVR